MAFLVFDVVLKFRDLKNAKEDLGKNCVALYEASSGDGSLNDDGHCGKSSTLPDSALPHKECPDDENEAVCDSSEGDTQIRNDAMREELRQEWKGDGSNNGNELEIDSVKSHEQLALLVQSKREQGIEEIQQQIGEVNEIFKDLAVLVHEQGVIIATDLVLTVTQMLRKHGVIGKFVKFYGEGVGKISLVDRATIANMSPKYGATMGFFPVDHVTLQYLKLTRRSEETVVMIKAYLRANKFVDYDKPQQEGVYSSYLYLDLADVEP
ncbi:hypothetical protein ACSBR2_014933 [Camellia fascicularis]